MIIDRYRRWVALDGAVLLIAGVLLLGAGAADAGTIHHWRFEDGAYLDDSIGGATLTDLGAAQSALPSSGRGWQFKGLAGGNTDATDVDFGDRMTTVLSDAPTGDFTIELFAHIDTLTSHSFGSVMAGTSLSNKNSDIGWLLQNRGGGLTLTMCDAASCELVLSGVPLAVGVDYYLAASWDQDGDATFYVQDLTNGGALQVVTASHALSGYNAIDTFTIGGVTASTLLDSDSLLDEVRFSDMVLAADQLLIADWSPPSVVPAPAAPWLVGAGAVVLGLRRGRGGG